MKCKENLEKYLQEHAVPYEVRHHRRAFTAQEIAAGEHIPGVLLAKVVMVKADGNLIMLVLPATERVHIPQVAHVIGAREIHLASEAEFAYAFPDCELGAMPPFGNLYNIPVYVDPVLAAEDTIYFQAGTHTETISMKYADYAHLVRPELVPFSLEEAIYRAL